MEDYIRSHNNVFTAHRLHRSSERIVEQVEQALVTLGLVVPPRSISMLLMIDEHGPIGVMEISRRLQLSHPLIVRRAQRFEELGLVTFQTDAEDARRKDLVPTDKARREAAMVRAFNAQLAAMYDDLFAEIDCPLIAVLDRLDAALDARSIAERMHHETIT